MDTEIELLKRERRSTKDKLVREARHQTVGGAHGPAEEHDVQDSHYQSVPKPSHYFREIPTPACDLNLIIISLLYAVWNSLAVAEEMSGCSTSWNCRRMVGSWQTTSVRSQSSRICD